MQPIVIAVGIGNTSIHVGVTRETACFPRWLQRLDLRTRTFQPADLAVHLPAEQGRWYIASVHRPSQKKLITWIRQHRPGDPFQILSSGNLPLELDVDAPSRVGMDRLVAAVAVNRLRQQDCPAIVVDAGTAITVDLVSPEGVFLGGAILPGMEMAARALATETDLLPEVTTRFDEEPPVIGKATDSAIRSGMYWGSIGAVRELVARISEQLGRAPQLFVTGGDAEKLAQRLGGRAVPDLVLAGIVSAAHASSFPAN